MALVLALLVLEQIYLGGLVAGLDAGLTYNTWPLIDGAFIPDAARLWFNTPRWRNLFENTLTVQFDHRMVAYTIWLAAVVHLRGALAAKTAVCGAFLLFAAVTLQAAIGIVTLLHQAPLHLALTHQLMAIAVLTIAIVHAERLGRRDHV
jgi:cytochrome c oxidase assembly protein subunit 15